MSSTSEQETNEKTLDQHIEDIKEALLKPLPISQELKEDFAKRLKQRIVLHWKFFFSNPEKNQHLDHDIVFASHTCYYDIDAKENKMYSRFVTVNCEPLFPKDLTQTEKGALIRFFLQQEHSEKYTLRHRTTLEGTYNQRNFIVMFDKDSEIPTCCSIL